MNVNRRQQGIRAGRITRFLLALTLASMLAACAVGPDYVRPAMDVPAAFKETPPEAKDWKPAQPSDEAAKGTWWEAFGDPQLNALEEQVDISNQNVKLAEARYRQARALVGSARAAYFPTLTADASATRGKSAQLGRNGATTIDSASTQRRAELDAAWELDLWGRLRRTVESNEANAAASTADLEAARLSAQAELARSYFLLRIQDAQIELLQRTVTGYEKSLQLTNNQYQVGIVARVDVTQAQTQLTSAQAQLLDAGIARAQFEHTIAVLLGKAPADFSLTPAPLAAGMPAIPAGLPSDLLERRPDIAAAERRVAAANAQIGIARAAYFPLFTFSAVSGSQAALAADLFTAPARFWSIGAALAGTLFDAGLRSSQSDAAIAAYDQTVATYRQTVLGGFQEVEDNLAALRILEQEAVIQDQAARAARDTVTIVTNQYQAGIVSYLNVVVAQSTLYTNERATLGILGQRLTSAVTLIKALGGSWDAAAMDKKN